MIAGFRVVERFRERQQDEVQSRGPSAEDDTIAPLAGTRLLPPGLLFSSLQSLQFGQVSLRPLRSLVLYRSVYDISIRYSLYRSVFDPFNL